MSKIVNVAILLAALQVQTAVADESQMTAADLIQMDFEDLVNMDVEIESAGKTTAKALDLPYAATVISSADIRQSGVSTIPDALRLAPGVVVGQIAAGEWAIGIRGGEGRFSRYVLVMIDGRIVYNSLFSGVNWDEINVTLDTVERIEVIRGPNAAAWGANAVNGIINIITKKPDGGSGTRLKAWGGSNQHGAVSVVSAFDVFEGWAASIAGHAKQWGGLKEAVTGLREGSHEDWRLSASLSKSDAASDTRLTAEAFGVDQVVSWGWPDIDTLSDMLYDNQEDKSGWNLQFVHQHQLTDSAYWKVRASNDSIKRDTGLYQWDAINRQLDLEVAATWGDHSLAMGVNTRVNKSMAIGAEQITLDFDPQERKLDYVGVYLSDQVQLNDKLSVTLAARYDETDNEFGHSNLQPSARLLWKLSDNRRFWMAISEATTAASRALRDLTDITYGVLPAEDAGSPYPLVLLVDGYDLGEHDPRLRALEMGYRQTFDRFNLDISLFDFSYKNDVSIVFSDDVVLRFNADYQPVYLEQRGNFANLESYDSYGGEVAMRGKLASNWSAQLAVSLVKRDDEFADWATKVSFLNSIQLAQRWQWNIWLRHSAGDSSSGLQYSKIQGLSQVDSYSVLDTNLVWSVTSDTKLSVLANNIGSDHTESRREEFVAELRLIEPYAMLKVEHQF